MSSTVQANGLAGRIAIVTGGTDGIGYATSMALYQAGATVVATYSSRVEQAKALEKAINDPERIMTVQSDGSSVSAIDALVRQVVSKYGRIDIVIANAGIMLMRELGQTTEEDFDKSFNLNVKGPYFLAQKAAPHMPTDGTGRIILLSTSVIATSTITPNYLLYGSTKGTIETMAKIIAKDLGRQNITVNAVAPGPTATDLFYKGKSQELVDTIAGFSPMKKIGQPSDIANVINFLAGPGGKWVSGQVYRVNGAMA